MKRCLHSLLGLSLTMVVSLSQAKELVPVEVDDSVIVSTVLCQNLPPITGAEKGRRVYSNYLDDVDQLFSQKAKRIRTSIMGPSGDEQVLYLLTTPVSIVGMEFDTLAITDLKDDNYIYYQLSAIKPFVSSDQSFIKNIPENNRLTVSTKGKQLKISCNIRIAK